MQVIYKESKKKELEYSHAYDEYGNYISIEGATGLSERRWFLDRDLTVEFNPVFKGQIQQPHWRTYPNQYLIIQGKKYLYSRDKDAESIQHKRFKGLIIENGFFEVDDLRIYITDPKEEWRIFDSRFKADILASLPCGMPCVIEVIKTSEISNKKEEFLRNNEILTFKLYIDENGNQIFQRDFIFGTAKIDQLIERIKDTEGAIVAIREERERFDTEISRRVESYAPKRSRIDAEISDLTTGIRDLESEIIGKEQRIGNLIDSSSTESEQRNERNQREIAILEDEIEEITRNIREIEQLIFNEGQADQRYAEQIPELEREIVSIEEKIREAIDRCKPEWFRPEWMKVNNVNKYNEIMWFIS